MHLHDSPWTGEVGHVHTNRTKGEWSRAKNPFKKMNGTSIINAEAHMYEILCEATYKEVNVVFKLLG